jgi:membrane associated rhomboid family serine protease
LSIFPLGEQVARQAVQGNSLNGFFLVRINDMAGAKGLFVTDQPTRPPLESQSEPIFFLAPAVTGIMAVCAGLYFLQTYVLGTQANASLTLELAFFPARYGADGAPLDLGFLISPVSYSLLHAGFGHLAINMIWLAAFGSPLAARIGALRFLLFWALTAIGAALLHFLVYSQSAVPLVGASGAVSGMMGAAARFSFRTNQGRGIRSFIGAPLSVGASLTNRTVLTFVGIWMAANLITGLGWSSGSANASNIAWEAHIGGFLVGFLCLSGFDRPMFTAR